MATLTSEKFNKLINMLNSRVKWDDDSIVSLVKDLEFEEQDVLNYQCYHHNTHESYGRNAIYENEHFRIYLMSWDSGDATAIHDHGKTDWGCVQFLGEAIHRRYELREENLVLCEADTISTGSVVPVNGNLIHLMANIGEASICTLHIYGNNSPNAAEEDFVSVYQPEFGRVVTTLGTAYLNMDKSKILTTSPMPKMTQIDYADYLKIITPFYQRIRKKL